MGLGFVVTAIMTAILSAAGTLYVGRYQADRTEMVQQIDAFQKSSGALDPLVGKYVDALLHNGDVNRQKDLLVANLREQATLLTSADPYLDSQGYIRARKYIDKLADVRDALNATTGPAAAGPFSQAIVDAVAQRQVVQTDLRQRESRFDLFEAPAR
jgi:hypothetical protein